MSSSNALVRRFRAGMRLDARGQATRGATVEKTAGAVSAMGWPGAAGMGPITAEMRQAGTAGATRPPACPQASPSPLPLGLDA